MQVVKECKWCGKACERFAKSHIIPKAFFNYDGKNDRFLVSAKNRKKRRPAGSYDKNILCPKCETDFSHIDSEAARILLHEFEKHQIPFNDERDSVCVQINGLYKQEITQFLIYVLWRASVSQLSEFKGINLGPYQDRIKEDLIKNKVFSVHDYSFASFKVNKPSGHIFPYKDKKENWNGVNYYILDFGGFIFNVKVDRRIPQEPYKSIAEHPHVPFIKVDKTPDKRRRAMVNIIKRHEALFG